MGFGITVMGVREQVQRFTNMTGNFDPHNISEIVNFCLQSVEDGAKSSAPVLSGFLKDSISHYMISEGFPTISGECFVGAEYGAAVEFGYVGRGGDRVPGRNYFTPNAIKGQNLFRKMMNDFIRQNSLGQKVAIPSASKGKGKKPTKFQFKQKTGAGTRYKYAPDRGTITRRFFIGQPGGRKQPGTSFGRPRGGSSGVRR